MTEKTEIVLTHDKLYALVQELKELKDLIPRVTTADYTKIYRLKIQIDTLNNILTNNGVDAMFKDATARKGRLTTDLSIKQTIENEEAGVCGEEEDEQEQS